MAPFFYLLYTRQKRACKKEALKLIHLIYMIDLKILLLSTDSRRF
jgi:hypothetical protein